MRVEAIIPGERGAIRAVDFASVVVRGEKEARRLSLVISRPRSVTVGRGGRAILYASPVDSAGRTTGGVEVSWETVGDGPGTIDQYGSFKASAGPGVYMSSLRVTATQDLGEERITRTATVDIYITGSLNDASIQPALSAVSQGDTIHFTALGRDENGLILPGLVVRWDVTDPKYRNDRPFGQLHCGQHHRFPQKRDSSHCYSAAEQLSWHPPDGGPHEVRDRSVGRVGGAGDRGPGKALPAGGQTEVT